MSVQSDALQWAKNNPGAEATAHLLGLITEHERTIAHLREVNAGHVKGLGTMRKRVRAARAETEALRGASVELHPTSVGTVVVRTTIAEPPVGSGRHRSLLLPTTLPNEAKAPIEGHERPSLAAVIATAVEAKGRPLTYNETEDLIEERELYEFDEDEDLDNDF